MDETSVVPGATVLVDLNGRSVLVTGAASGIGRACAERFARAGASVTVLDLNGEGARKVAEEMGGKAVQAGLSDYEVLGRLEIEADIVINNAGLQYVAAIEDFPPERFAMILRVMLEAPFRLVSAALPGMYEKGWGVRSTSPACMASGLLRSRRPISRRSMGWRDSQRSSPWREGPKVSRRTASVRPT